MLCGSLSSIYRTGPDGLPRGSYMFSLVERRRAAAGAGASAAGAGAGFTGGGWLAVAVAGALMLSGCSGSGDRDADAAETPSVSSSSSSPEAPSPSPSPSAVYKPASAEGPAENVPLPVMPEEAKVESKEGLIAFARHWYDLANYGYETGDVEPLKAISGPDCTACSNLYPVIAEGYANGGWIAGAEVMLQDATSTFVLTEQSRYQATVQMLQDPLEFYSPIGKQKTQSGNSLPAFQLFEAEFDNGSWQAVEVVTLYVPD